MTLIMLSTTMTCIDSFVFMICTFMADISGPPVPTEPNIIIHHNVVLVRTIATLVYPALPLH
jgi:hypothetical protein